MEGVAVMTFGEEEPVLDQLVHHDIPMVLAEFKLDDPKASTILLDYTTGIHAAVNHLAELGHSSIAFLAGPHKLHSAMTRENDFPHGDAGCGAADQKKWIIECDHTLKGGVAGFGKLQALAARPTAILCSNDMTAIGVLRAAYMEGLRVPQDLSVIGLDDIDFAEFTLPPLTTIRLSRTDLARAAFEALRQQAEDPGNPKIRRRVFNGGGTPSSACSCIGASIRFLAAASRFNGRSRFRSTSTRSWRTSFIPISSIRMRGPRLPRTQG